MPVREPVVAGQFYPDGTSECRCEAEECLGQSPAHRAEDLGLARLLGGIVPHAGWICSGAVAAEVFRTLAAEPGIETYVLFGAAHHPIGPAAAVYADGLWRTPLGELAIDEPLAQAVTKASPLLVADPAAHRFEHSIEVQLPFLQHVAAGARLLPILVPPTASAHEVGRLVAEQTAALGRRALFVGSSDLTHYGPRYYFTPKGIGPDGVQWSKEVNDRQLLDLVLALQADRIVAEALTHHSACGSGAIAATIAAACQQGADAARLLRHTSSSEVLRSRLGEMEDSVGYAGVVFGVKGEPGGPPPRTVQSDPA